MYIYLIVKPGKTSIKVFTANSYNIKFKNFYRYPCFVPYLER